jgi:DNA polymerase III epsilon subunit-like protein
MMRRSKYIYFDTETSGLRVRYPGEDFLVGLTLAFDDKVTEDIFYIPFNHYFEGKYQIEKLPYHTSDEGSKKKKQKEIFETRIEHAYRARKLSAKDFPDFDEKMLCGNWHNMDWDRALELFKPIIESGRKILVAHNGMFDWHVLQNEGIDVLKMTEKLNYDR